MSIIWTILIGFIVGLLAKFVMPGKDPGGFFVTAAIGIVGSLIATYGGKAFAAVKPIGPCATYGGEETAGFIGAFIGAVILLILYRLLMRNRST